MKSISREVSILFSYLMHLVLSCSFLFLESVIINNLVDAGKQLENILMFIQIPNTFFAISKEAKFLSFILLFLLLLTIFELRRYSFNNLFFKEDKNE